MADISLRKERQHLAFVASHPCMICRGPAVVHHLLKPWHGHRGTGMKSKVMNTVPLCDPHHRALHNRGAEEAFFEEEMGNPNAGKNEARRLWNDFWEGDGNGHG